MMIHVLISAIIAVSLFAAWRDYQSGNRLYRALIIIISGGFLLGFLLQPNWWSTDHQGRYAVLSDGFDETSFSGSDYDSTYSIQSTDTIKSEANYDKWLGSLHFLQALIPGGSTIDFYGYGSGEKLPTQYRWTDKLNTPEPGIILLEAPGQVKTGQPFDLSVKLLQADEDDTLALYRDGRLIQTKNPDTDNNITFTDELYSRGPAHYHFEWMHADSLIFENLHIRAVQPERLSIAVLLYSPSFELNHFQETFAERGHRFSTRIRLGQNQFRFDNLNSPPASSEELLAANLNQFDLLILDPREYAELSTPEKNSITEALRSGLDILFTAPSSDNPEQWTEIFTELSGLFIELNPLNRLSERMWIPENLVAEISDLNPVPLLNLDFNINSNDYESLFEYSTEQSAAIRHPVENGSITLQLFYQTYRWLLRGETALYKRFWAQYLGNIITLESSFLEISDPLPRKGHKSVITVSAGNPQTKMDIYSVMSGATINLPVVYRGENPNVDYVNFWPSETGWHRADSGNKTTWFYVYDNDWNTDLAYRNHHQTKRQIANLSVDIDAEQSSQRHPLPDCFWLIGFLLLQAVLWAERKLV